MTTQGEDIKAGLDRLGDRICEAAEIVALPIGLVAVALNSVASAMYSYPRRPAGIGEDPDWAARTPGRHTTTTVTR